MRLTRALSALLIACVVALSWADVIIYEAEVAHSTQNVEKAADSVTLTQLTSQDDQGHIVFTVFAGLDGTYATTLRFKHHENAATSAVSVRVNGHPTSEALQLGSTTAGEWTEHTASIPLRRGLNTVVFQNRDQSQAITIDRIAIDGAMPQATRGATLPYVEMEAENGQTTGKVIGPDRTYKTLASEASGRKAVQLSGSQYVEFTLTAPANAIVVRLSIPDTSDGKGNYGTLQVYADGAHLTNLSVTSHNSWVYGDYPYSKIPSQGNAHRFYDETRGMFPSTVKAGAKIRLVPASNFVYTIDLADFWNAPGPYAQPVGYLTVAQYGADPSGVKDSSQAFKSAISAASSQGKGLYIAEGKYLVSSRFSVNTVLIRGAGPWHTIIQASAPAASGFYGNGPPTVSQNVEIYDLALFGVTNHRVDSDIDGGFGGSFDKNCIIQNIWIQHTKVGIWVSGPFQGLHMTGLIIHNTYADGINLNIGVANTVIEQSSIRNTGDDCLAMWSESKADTNNVIQFNTVQLPMLANTVGIYGGSGNSATDNVLSDTVIEGAGIQVSNRFDATVPLSGTTTIARNTISRCGGLTGQGSGRNGAIWLWATDSAMSGTINLSDLDINDSANSAITFWGLTTLTNTKFSHINVNGTPHVVSVWGTSGSTYMEYVVATGVSGHAVCSCMTGKFTFQAGSGNTGWSLTDTQCDSSC